MSRVLIAIALVTLVALATGSVAGATHCVVANKPTSAGAKLAVDTTTGSVTPLSPAAAHARAGFATLDFDGDNTGDASAFYFPVTPGLEDEEDLGLGSLPDGAHNSGPGDSDCDGNGIDDIFACGG
jgi:hypothetical protein